MVFLHSLPPARSQSEILGSPDGRSFTTPWLAFLAAAFYTLMLNIVTSEAASTRRQKRADFSILHSVTSFHENGEKVAKLSTSPAIKAVGRSPEVLAQRNGIQGYFVPDVEKKRKKGLDGQEAHLLSCANNVR